MRSRELRAARAPARRAPIARSLSERPTVADPNPGLTAGLSAGRRSRPEVSIPIRARQVSSTPVVQAARAPSTPRGEELGEFITSFRRHWAEPAALWIVSALALAALSLYAFTSTAPLTRFFAAPSFGIASALILYAAAALGYVQIFVHRHGFGIETSRSTTLLLYSQIHEVRERQDARGTVLEIVAGTLRLEIASQRPELAKVAKQIIERAMPIIAPRCAADFYAGEDLDFGPIKLSRHRVATTSWNGNLDELALRDVAKFAVENGRLTIDIRAAGQSRRTRFCAIPLADIANFAALEMLLSRVCPEEISGRTPTTKG